MGQVQSTEILPRSVPTDTPVNPGESPVYRNIHLFLENGGDFIATFRSQPESCTPLDVLKTSSIKWPDQDCTGMRQIYEDGTAGEYQWWSYKKFYESCLTMGRGMLQLGLKRGDKVGIFSNNSRYWQLVAFGAYSVGLIVVPVYDSLGKDAAEYIVDHAEVKVIFCNTFKYPSAVSLIPQLHTLEKIVLMAEYIPKEPECSLPTMTVSDVLKMGEGSTEENNFGQPDETAIIMYTSGSTGKPKGCVLTHRNIVAGATGLASVNTSLTTKDTHMSFLPLAHIYAMCVELIMFAQGVRVGYARGTVKDLVDDIKALQPTVLIAVPRILNKVSEVMKAKIEEKPAPLRKFIKWAFAEKIKAMKANRGHSLLLDSIIFANFREALGGRLRVIVSGGAPILQEIFEFFCAAVTPNIVQGYGMTEISSSIAVQEMPAWNPATVGPVTLSTEFKLRPVEGTDYDPLAEVPTGELLVRGPTVFQGYYKAPELTKEAFVDGDWFATGDIVKLTPEKHIQIIDRAKQLVKLSQGEYLSMTTLNETYAMADILSFIYVYANPNYDQPIAVCIPLPDKIKEWQANSDISDLTTDRGVHKEILQSLEKVFVERKLRGFERIKYIIVDTFEPTIENGLLTPSMKPNLAALRKRYEPQLLDLYQMIAEKRIPDLTAK
ncbi:putative AMP-binding enzyme protein [Tritrichomonas foetus]|uniref:AMP-binding enzyme protein n=1 Tax=Tritrichomonas foetus TaxID=1144522 RepID=A0A1J4JT57_9EUKA|nr:putative AMP-binding enzyme protein [Tritrichomonas foetus]|eukprot:OHT02251.1 putative AMP-binding enzyme protein [Tritrichomonas foetus]